MEDAMLRKLLAALALATVATTASAQDKPVLTVYTYESFSGEYGPGKPLQTAFEAKCNCKLTYVTADDGGALFAKLKLEGASTKADVVVGLDDNLMGEAEKSGLFAPHGVAAEKLSLPEPWTNKTFIPYDWGYFAFVYDSDKLKNPPASLKDLVDDKNGPKLVIEDPRTSTPGLGLLAWMKAVYGDKASDAWKSLKPRIVTVTSGWSEAYGLFLKGEADMVLSYSTSPAYHIGAEKKTNYKAAMFPEGHQTQVEVAGLIQTSKQQDLGRQFLTFLISDEAQAVLPETNWMYPARTPAAGLPESFKAVAVPAKALMADPAKLAENRKAWIDEWLAAMAK
ncbi:MULTISPECIES: thiamine ABC transporter substrate binding subunit [Labrys]|uniref:thiamine ABC transporter substrate binding subunit n=1 Tax=Labrys TaxID=204476 RepID=UPI0012EAAD4B|nr:MULTISPECIES: thiamine ABC transporter substrate binding subunit [unclassified Labrys (in: a-proteobacteria)]MDZ5450170.1 thiamine ABC transporter substrate binding subunit [Labrys sp. ZIDIC5]